MKYLTCAETAKILRKTLKNSFANTKFSIRSKSYTNGATIRVSWTDGACEKEVKRITDSMEGASFDGMIDYKSCNTHKLNGEIINFGADYIFTERNYSENTFNLACDVIARKYNIDKKLMNYEMFNIGKLRNVKMFDNAPATYHNLQQYIKNEMNNINFDMKIKCDDLKNLELIYRN